MLYKKSPSPEGLSLCINDPFRPLHNETVFPSSHPRSLNQLPRPSMAGLVASVSQHPCPYHRCIMRVTLCALSGRSFRGADGGGRTTSGVRSSTVTMYWSFMTTYPGILQSDTQFQFYCFWFENSLSKMKMGLKIKASI